MSVELSSLTLDAAGTCSQGDFCRGLSRSVEVCQVAVELSRAILSSRLSSSCRVSCRVVEARAQSQTRDRYVMRRTIRAICAQVNEHYRRARGVRGDGLSESATNVSATSHLATCTEWTIGVGDAPGYCTYVKTVNSSGRELERASGWCHNAYRTTHPTGTTSETNPCMQ
jgi:hypothetical protein